MERCQTCTTLLLPLKHLGLTGSELWSRGNVQRCFYQDPVMDGWVRCRVCVPLGACTHTHAEHHPGKVTAPRNDRWEQSDVAPRVCSSVVVFSASGGVWTRSSLGASLCVAVSGGERSGRSSQLRIMGKKAPFVQPGAGSTFFCFPCYASRQEKATSVSTIEWHVFFCFFFFTNTDILEDERVYLQILTQHLCLFRAVHLWSELSKISAPRQYETLKRKS